MELEKLTIIIIGCFVFGFVAGSSLIDGMLKSNKNKIIRYAALAVFSYVIITSVSMFVDDGWKDVSAIMGACFAALFTILASGEVNRVENNRVKAEQLVLDRFRTLNIMLVELSFAQEIAGQTRYLMELCLNEQSEAESGNEETRNKFMTLASCWPAIQSPTRVNYDINNISFPASLGKIYLHWNKMVTSFNEHMSVNDSFVDFKLKKIIPKITKLNARV